jgi:protein-S-isoprenylcysteine O-methyltransferase Ste14
MVLEGIGFAIVYLHRPHTWAASLPDWRAAVGTVFAVSSTLVAWTAVRHLGRQWRFDAGLNADHELVQTGPYRIVRHPIYAAMLLMFCAVISWLGTLPGWPLGLVFFVVGTEIRVRIEDGLLKRQFGDRFIAWQRVAPAYLPFLR